mgnify:CR=1 FL=1
MKEKLLPPTREQIALFPPFQGMTLDHIQQPGSPEALVSALQELLASPFVGFGTESKPVFRKDQASDGPHVTQLCTTQPAYIFQVQAHTAYPPICQVVESEQLA